MARPRWTRDDKRVHLNRVKIYKNGVQTTWCGLTVPIKAHAVADYPIGADCQDCLDARAKVDKELGAS